MSACTRPARLPSGVGDFDHDGASDVMWRNTATGHIDNGMLA